MKKIIYLVCSLAVALTSCDPMDGVYDELDELHDQAYTKTFEITLVNKEYETIKTPAYVAKKHYFASEEDAAAQIPSILASKYPQLDNNSAVTVNYNQLFLAASDNVATSVVKYTLEDVDYDVTGDGKYDSFNSASDMIKFLKATYPEATEGMLVVLTYDYYNGKSTDLTTDSFLFLNGAWMDIHHVTDAEFESVNHNYHDFTAADNELLSAYFNKFLSNEIYGAKVGDVQYVSYDYYASGAHTQKVARVAYDGNKWYVVNKDVVNTASLTFAKKNGQWVPDLTVRYTLAEADYVWIGSQANATYGTADSRGNLANYKNFNVSSSSSPTFWSDADIVSALGALLKYKYPNAEVGQKFMLTYTTYKGSGSYPEVTTTLIKQESGEYKVYVEGE